MKIIYIRKKKTFDNIANGKKTIECRKLSNFMKEINKKEIIIFKHDGSNNEIRAIVNEIIIYDNFKNLFKNENIKKILCKAYNVDDALDIYSVYYNKKTLNKSAICLKFIICNNICQ